MTTGLLAPLHISALRIGKIMVMNQMLSHPKLGGFNQYDLIKEDWEKTRRSDPDTYRDYVAFIRSKQIEDHRAITSIRAGQPWQQVTSLWYGFQMDDVLNLATDGETLGLYLSDAPYEPLFKKAFIRSAAAYLVLAKPFFNSNDPADNNQIPSTLDLQDRSELLWTSLKGLPNLAYLPDIAPILGAYLLENVGGPPDAYYCRGSHLKTFPVIESESTPAKSEEHVTRVTLDTDDGTPALIRDKHSDVAQQHISKEYVRFVIV